VLYISNRVPVARSVETPPSNIYPAVESSFIPNGRAIDESNQSFNDDGDDDAEEEEDGNVDHDAIVNGCDDASGNGDDDDDESGEDDDDNLETAHANPSQDSFPIAGQRSASIDPTTNHQVPKPDDSNEVLYKVQEESGRKSGGVQVGFEEDAHVFDQTMLRDYHFSRLLSWEAALREREERLLIHSSSMADRSRHSFTSMEAEKPYSSTESALSPHIHIHNHLSSVQHDPKRKLPEDSSHSYERQTQGERSIVGNKPTVVRASSTQLKQSDRDSKDVLYSSIDLSGLSLEVRITTYY